ncbi:M15 family metallopeptidase [Arthrobacter gengyunqii]|uniref:M15 family metallopeptidase n=1 Tax=Arthrobacter gengyunqii TaxID=2886940 RepID=A0ABS8GKF3_9MICC|nr:M15 family metallopeptidase [Arthrobacter gengyunqii]MCC3267157.1 M15 family metallopeptidase [Arthrobacter gengyunqii]
MSACEATPPWAGGPANPRTSDYPPDAEICSEGTCTPLFELRTPGPANTGDNAIQRDIDNPASIAVVVNKQRPLNPVVYVPADLVAVEGQYLRAEAAASYARFAEAAASDGVAVVAASGYRSHDSQAGLYAGYVAQYGQEIADSISARPGHSEHQTGLAVDIAVPDGSCSFQACFEETDAGRWAAENAHRFGFILRYPDGGSETTGYTYEPWHLRFVGPDIAEGMRTDSTATLEEYLGLAAAADY